MIYVEKLLILELIAICGRLYTCQVVIQGTNISFLRFYTMKIY